MVRLDIKDSKTELSSFTWTNIKLVHLNADIIILECQLENIPILNVFSQVLAKKNYHMTC